jgi:hypothetical protein
MGADDASVSTGLGRSGQQKKATWLPSPAMAGSKESNSPVAM